MTAPISLLKAFTTGQGAGASTYITYAEDLDSNFTSLETAVNSLATEVSAFGAANASLITEFLKSTSPSITAGVVGADSFAPVSFLSGNTVIRVPAGVAYTGNKVASLANTDLTGTGSSGTRYTALRSDGSITLETISAQGVMDLWSVNWNGASFDTATLTRLPAIMPDGDDFQGLRIQENNGSGVAVPAFTYEQIKNRVADIVRIMSAKTTSADTKQAALGRIAIGGAVATPGLILGDGTTFELDSGLYRSGADQLSVSINATEALQWGEGATDEPQTRLRAGATLAHPPLAFLTDLNTGLGYVSADRARLVAGALSCLEWNNNGGVADVAVPGTMSGAGANRFGNLPESIKTGTYTVLAADRGTAIIGNSASPFTVNLTAAATLGAGFTFVVKNINAGAVTIDPNGAETINGAATIALANNESAIVWCNGTLFRAFVTTAGGGSDSGEHFATPEQIKTGNYTVVAGDVGDAMVANSATALTFALTAAATLGAGFTFYVKNINDGTLTIDPNGAETIDGATTIAIEKNDGALIYCNGTLFRTLKTSNGQHKFATEGTKTANYTVVSSDAGSAIICDSATPFTVSFTAAATLGAGHVFYVKNINAGVITLDPNGAETINGATTFLLRNGQGCLVWNNGTAFRAIVGTDTTRRVLTAALNLYVRTDGNDANDGEANTAGRAFLTIQAAINKCYTLDQNGFAITVNVIAGTYTAGGTIDQRFTGAVTLLGDPTTPSNVLISVTSAQGITVSNPGSVISISGFKITTTTAGQSIFATAGGVCRITGNMDFGVSASNHLYAQYAGTILVQADYNITGNAAGAHIQCELGGVVVNTGRTITITGTPSFGSAFARVTETSVLQINNNTFSGSATGARFFVNHLGIIYVNGAATTYLPGNAAGTEDATTFGVYD